jgi:uncharacterized protein YegL
MKERFDEREARNVTTGVPLILSRTELTPFGAGAVPRPGTAAVYATENGDYEWLTGRGPTRWFSRYRARFEVDVGDHRRRAHLAKSPLPCSDQVHRFEASVDVGFRVTDPVEVVRRNVGDALVVVYGHLTAMLRQSTRRFTIEQAAQAETYINDRCLTPIVLPEGITVYRCVVELHPDQAARRHIAALTEAGRALTLGQATHTVAVAEVRGEAILEEDRLAARLERERAEQHAQLARRAAEERALAQVNMDLEGLLRRHLVSHPEDTRTVLDMLATFADAAAGRQDEFDRRSVEVFRFMVDKDIIQPGDVEVLRQEALGRVRTAAGSGGTHTALPPVYWGGSTAQPQSGPAAGQGTGGPAPRATAGPGERSGGGTHPRAVLPVYLVLDESPAAAGCLQILNNALRSLHTALVSSPGTTDGIRLSILGMAGDTTVGLALSEVGWGTRMPTLAVRGGTDHGAAFGRLLAVVPADVEALKKLDTPVLRPIVFMLTAGTSDDGAQWRDRLAELLDPATNRYHPTIVAVGIGRAREDATAHVATHPELGFVARAETDPATAAEQFSSMLQTAVLRLGRSLVTGSVDLVVECPPGLRPAVAAE